MICTGWALVNACKELSSYHTNMILMMILMMMMMMMILMMMTRYAPVDGGDQRHGYHDERE